MYKRQGCTLIILHLLGASVWVGGHLVLLLSVLPKALRDRDPTVILRFEHPFERIGIPALVLQLITGLLLAHRYVPGILPAFDFADRIHQVVAIKLILLSPQRSPAPMPGSGSFHHSPQNDFRS